MLVFVLAVPELEPEELEMVVVAAAAAGPLQNSSGRQLPRRGYLELTCLFCLCVEALFECVVLL